MLTIETYLAPSFIHGIGLFAVRDIDAGEVIWRFDSFIDRIIPQGVFLAMCRKGCEATSKHLLSSSYKRNGRYYYLTDNARFINHSENANIAFSDDYTEIASRRISAGEELLENYLTSYDQDDYFFLEMLADERNNYFDFVERCAHHAQG